MLESRGRARQNLDRIRKRDKIWDNVDTALAKLGWEEN